MKLIIEFEKGEVGGSPKNAIKETITFNFIEDEPVWQDIHRFRNLTTK